MRWLPLLLLLTVPAAAQQISPSIGHAPQVVCQSGASASVTGTVSETNLAICTLPASTMGANDSIRITTLWSYTNSVNSKTIRIRWSSSSGDVSGGFSALAVGVTTTANANYLTSLRATNSTSAQTVLNTGTTGPSASAIVNANLDTTTTLYLNFNAQLANTGETITLLGYTVELVKT